MNACDLIDTWRMQTREGVRLVAFGSSNTELFWHSQGCHNWADWLSLCLREWVGRHVGMTNSGVCGETSIELLQRLDRDVLSWNPSAVVITIGGNDMRRMNAATYRDNLIQLVDRLEARGVQPIFQSYYCFMVRHMDEEAVAFYDFMDVFCELARERGLPLLDQMACFRPYYEGDPEDYAELMLDVAHVTPLGNAIMGLLAARMMGLPDPVFTLELRQNVDWHLAQMNKFAPLPQKVTPP